MAIATASWKERIRKQLLLDPKPFAMKQEVNWKALRKFALIGIGSALLVILLLPQAKEEAQEFQEKTETASSPARTTDPSQDAWSQLQQNQVRLESVPRSIDHLYGGSSGGAGNSGNDRNASMILVREGADAKTQLPPGAKIVVQLSARSLITGHSMPVIGIVAKDVLQEGELAIPKGAKLFGEATFNDSTERANISWRAVQLPDGRERQFSAIGVGLDSQIGMEGRVHSEAVKNAVGQTITRFIGAYAEGSIQRGALGASDGGSENGLKNAIAETAKDRAEAWAEDMKKEKKWIELEAGQEAFAVLTQAFSFRDPGSTYGR